MTTSTAQGVTVEAGGAPAPGSGHTYRQILKSSILIGGSSIVTVGIGIVRSKAMALLLGPAGFGLLALYNSILDLAQSLAAMGINSSGVRQIAAASGTGDTERIARTATVLRRTSVLLGLAGALLLVALSGRAAEVTFGSPERAVPVALLGLAVLCRVMSDGQGALVQGMRRIGDLARIAVLGGALGTVAAIALVYAFREQGVVPALVAMAAATLVVSWWHSRKASASVPVPFGEARAEVGALLKLGVAFMGSGLLMMGAAYLVRLIVSRQIGVAGAGLYQAAWSVGGMYVGFVLQAMGADFYPRLAALITDRERSNRLVNEQAHVNLLLAGPGVLATLTFAPLVITAFYSRAFGDSVVLLRWLCLGATLRVITWPMGFIVVAGAMQTLFLALEAAYALFYVLAAWAGVRYLGLTGAGVAFLASYVFHGLLVYPVVRRVSGFRWSASNKRLVSRFLAVVGGVFCALQLLPGWLGTAVGTVAMIGSALYSARALARLVSLDRLPRALRRLVPARWAAEGAERSGEPSP